MLRIFKTQQNKYGLQGLTLLPINICQEWHALSLDMILNLLFRPYIPEILLHSFSKLNLQQWRIRNEQGRSWEYEVGTKSLHILFPKLCHYPTPTTHYNSDFNFLKRHNHLLLVQLCSYLLSSLPPFCCPITRQTGLPSPCLSVNWKAWTNLRVSSTERPTGRSFTVIWRRIPLSSMIKRPLGRKDWKMRKRQYWFKNCFVSIEK